MRLLVVVVGVVVSGCANSWDMPEARVRPESLDPAVSDEAWTAAVLRAARAWNDALATFDCPAPFDLSPVTIGAHPILLVPLDAWEFGSSDGITYGDWPTQPAGAIEIRADADGPDGRPDDWQSALLHEMGHAIGLGHRERMPPTIMCASASCSAPNLTMADIADAAEALGCVNPS